MKSYPICNLVLNFQENHFATRDHLILFSIFHCDAHAFSASFFAFVLFSLTRMKKKCFLFFLVASEKMIHFFPTIKDSRKNFQEKRDPCSYKNVNRLKCNLCTLVCERQLLYLRFKGSCDVFFTFRKCHQLIWNISFEHAYLQTFEGKNIYFLSGLQLELSFVKSSSAFFCFLGEQHQQEIIFYFECFCLKSCFSYH